MRYNPKVHPRRSIRLPGYDYRSPGAYSVTICTRQAECVFGEVVDGAMRLNQWGKVVCGCWQAIPEHFSHVRLDAYVVMPDQVHGILVIHDSAVGSQAGAQHAALLQSGAPLQPSPTNVQSGSLGAIVRSFKSALTRRINQLRDMASTPVWQRDYWEHIIRNEESLNRIREYIENNPSRCTAERLWTARPRCA
jgi:putative transposase